ncbi:VIT1/CCC1 transporter family protein [Companilactobacillus pabuli]|jgi:VIT1/CCC1 family predicted Fe2+/Mn2+ transporter|uniref:VIT family protein n=1 Tax=Companilactobacillus pabuli TaxID=2714036 RepID=A0A7L7KTQ3_9LACO|nr:VIT family protein [Companilactobacillus pabuli]AKP03106.1 membrane protein [Companilactobacillus farciminis]AKS51406.1 membrane protein [Companilactobacillus farciminis]MDG5112192.1 VIT family protein [Companilactobacillus pabuli]QMT83170.1 VIT family protein [Companilactobacillus pabuli]GAQ01815.1 membrane protein [Companilactobacillus farciminis]
MPKAKKKQSLAEKINVMRASVMGANDGIISIAGIVIGVASAQSNNHAIFLSGIAGMLAGTVSMAMGEWVSVSTQSDSEKRAVEKESAALDGHYDDEFDFIRNKYQATGISNELATQATKEMMSDDPLEVAVREKYGFNPKEKTSAIAAAMASMISFPTGSILPLVSITMFPQSIKMVATVIAVMIALAITGYTAAALGGANRGKAVLRNIVSGLLTMLVTYLIGSLFAH